MVFEKATNSENKTIWILAEKDNNMFGTDLTSLVQEPTYNSWT